MIVLGMSACLIASITLLAVALMARLGGRDRGQLRVL
jgi:hypothetical protein